MNRNALCYTAGRCGVRGSFDLEIRISEDVLLPSRQDTPIFVSKSGERRDLSGSEEKI